MQHAVVEVKGRSNMRAFKTDQYGEYYRLLLPGTHTFTVEDLDVLIHLNYKFNLNKFHEPSEKTPALMCV